MKEFFEFLFLFIIVVSIAVGLLLTIYLFYSVGNFITCYFDELSKNDNATKMRFSEFKKYYYINPGKWTIGHIETECPSYMIIYYKNYQKNYYINFNFIDYIKLRFFICELKRNKKKETSSKVLEGIIKDIIDDVEKYKKDNGLG